jgi:hypothetical protein
MESFESALVQSYMSESDLSSEQTSNGWGTPLSDDL